jgi:dienelactone hydrolase
MPLSDTEELNALGIVGRFYLPQAQGTSAAILVLGGSDGGIGYASSLGKQLSARGYAVLALAYFQKGTLPPVLAELPLEYFDAAVKWLENHPRIDSKRLGVFGFSKGAEAALLLASRNKSICAVVAAAPSHVAWEGLNRYKPAGRSSWSVHGSPVRYVPYDRSIKFSSPQAMYKQSLDVSTNLHETRIAVEEINGPVLLLSGGKDNLWPSAHMAEQIMDKLTKRDISYEHQHICYQEAGHAVAPLFRLRDRMIFRVMSGIFGGVAKANRSAQLDAWDRTALFFGRHLGTK